MLACLKWLNDFQVLACIPMNDKISVSNVSDLLGVPALELCRVVRMTATAGILCEPEPGSVAHTPMSIYFVTRPSLLDTTVFIAATAAPTALHMADATRVGKDALQAHVSAYGLFSNSSASLEARCEQEPRLRRQVVAFQRFAASVADEDGITAISSLDWHRLGAAKVVEVS